MPDETVTTPARSPAAPADPRSTLVVPITVSAAYLERTLDDVLDGIRPEHGLLYQREELDLGHGITGTVQVWRRGSTHVAMAGDTVNAALPVRVVLLPSWTPQLGPLSLPLDISLPLDVTAEYTVRLQARPQIDNDYNLRLNASFSYEVDRPVGIEAVGMGVTLSGATRRAAEEALEALGDWLNSDDFHYLNFREEAERGWQAVQRPFELAPGHHFQLSIHPEGVHARPFRTRGEFGVLELAVVARIRAQTSTTTPEPPAPLPGVSPGEAPDGIALSLPLEASFASLEAALRDNIANHPWQFDGRHLLLRDVNITGDDDGSLQVRVSVAVTSSHGGFEVDGTLSASGRPRLDIERQHLSLEDFRYDVDTDSRLLNIAATVLRPFAGAILEPWLGLPLAPQAGRLLGEVNARLDTGIALGEGVQLHGRMDGVRLTGLAVSAHALALMVETHGDLQVLIDRRA